MFWKKLRLGEVRVIERIEIYEVGGNMVREGYDFEIFLWSFLCNSL